jgi:hypothetical protein
MKWTFLSLLFLPFYLLGQGCSSAGFCTMGALKSDQNFSFVKKIKVNYVELSQLLAFTGLSETIQATTLDASVSISAKNRIQVRLPYIWVSGDLGNTRGFGDVYLTYTRNIIQKKNYEFNAMVGTKFPRFTTNITTSEGLPLPMYYSPSLGTYDIVLGASFINKNWLLGVGLQQPIANKVTDNQFSPNRWANTSLESQAKRYTHSVNLIRGGDIMLRIERNFRFNRYNFHIGLLPVYRFEKDQVLKQDEIVALEGSNGLAMTGILGAGYGINLHSRIKLFYGHRLLQRVSNADGLMKTSVSTIAYEWRF